MGKLCQSCGTLKAPAANFCMNCGTSLSGQPLSAHQRQLTKKLRKWLKHPLTVAIITFILTLTVQWLLGPPSDSTVTALMTQEIQASMTHDLGLVARIYDAHAVIMDAGCQSPSQGHAWSGLADITARYDTLPQFASLDHADPHISWAPNNRSAMKAYASATTIGALGAGVNTSSQPIRGHEQWNFANTSGQWLNGQWLITSFTYNLCLP